MAGSVRWTDKLDFLLMLVVTHEKAQSHLVDWVEVSRIMSEGAFKPNSCWFVDIVAQSDSAAECDLALAGDNSLQGQRLFVRPTELSLTTT